MRHYLLFGAVTAALTVFSCTKEKLERPSVKTDEERSELTVTLNMPEASATKAISAYTDARDYEAAVNSVQVFVFDESGALNGYGTASEKSLSLSVTAGKKTVYAVVNGPDLSSVKTKDQLQTHTVGLAANSISASKGFIMVGNSACTVSGSTTSCPVTVSRLVSRVVLKSVNNSLPSSYGAFTINRVWLSNVVGNQNLEGNATAVTWYNKEGRADEDPRVREHIIGTSTYKASVEPLTYASVGQAVQNGSTYTPQTPHLFYSYPNSSTTAPDGFVNPFAPQRSVLVVDATVDGQTYYYPVILDNAVLDRNTTYTVALTITGLGSDDPNKPVTKGSLTVSLSVSGWAAGAVYEEVL